MTAETVHASAALVGDSGVLIRGAPGSGKSALLLALLHYDPQRTALIADDRVVLSTASDRLLATAPAVIAGKMEIRGQGIVCRPHVSPAVIDLVVDLAPPNACSRMPEDEEATAKIAGITLARLVLPAGSGDRAARVNLAVERARAG